MSMPTEEISVEPDSSVRSAEPDRKQPDWRFATTPFWMFSHLFALAMVSLFVVLGLWQLDRLEERRAQNEVVEARTSSEPLPVEAGPLRDDLEFRPAVVTGEVVEPDVARIANRSQGGVAGEYVVAIVELGDGSLLAVNRGFVPVNAEVELIDLPTGTVELSGWLRNSVEPEGWFAVADTGEGRIMPRLNTAALSDRLDRPVVAAWLQLAAPDNDSATTAQFPDPVPLPELSEGPHLSYAGQWFIFAVLGTVFYLATVRRRAHRRSGDVPDEGLVT